MPLNSKLYFLSLKALRFRRCPSGSNAVEFAVLAPLLCFMVIGMAYLALFLGTAHSLAQIAADVSRYAMVGHDPDERQELASRWMARTATSYPLIDVRRLQLETIEADEMMTVSLDYDISYLPMPTLLVQMLDLKPSIVRHAAVLLP